tara:strand:- start:118 stop:768 length:651 start_codon:yes stop_codon:yes gene_type:complete
MSKIETNTIDTISGSNTMQIGSTNTSTINIGASGDTVNIPSGVTFANAGTATGFGGITQSDMWHMTSNITEDVGDITANWSRYTGPGGNIGSALTESSGIFSFPSTGYYKIDYVIGFRNQSSDHAFTEVYCYLFYTQNNSSYTDATTSYTNVPQMSSSNVFTSAAGSAIIDVTDTSQVKFKLRINAYAGASQQNGIIIGSSTGIATGFTCVRLADT